jgi:hypothetical protein
MSRSKHATRQRQLSSVFIVACHNRRRLHSAMGYRSPVRWGQRGAAAEVVTVSTFPGKGQADVIKRYMPSK